ncbi:MAG: PqqD family peptide modification chaperone [Clostridiales bacterium]|nr:PqqD family peptide modification chaperone [Clostridiales bacterium]
MNDTDTFQVNPDFVCREIAGEVILVPTGKTAEQFSGLASLNKTGLFLWNFLKEKKTFAELGFAMAEEYELTEEESSQDVANFLNLAMSKGVVLRC